MIAGCPRGDRTASGTVAEEESRFPRDVIGRICSDGDKNSLLTLLVANITVEKELTGKARSNSKHIDLESICRAINPPKDGI